MKKNILTIVLALVAIAAIIFAVTTNSSNKDLADKNASLEQKLGPAAGTEELAQVRKDAEAAAKAADDNLAKVKKAVDEAVKAAATEAGNQAVTEEMSQAIEAAQTAVNEATAVLNDAKKVADDAKKAASEAATQLAQEKLAPIYAEAEAAAASAKEKLEAVMKDAEGALNGLPGFDSEAQSKVGETISKMQSAAADAMNAAKTEAEDAMNKATEAIKNADLTAKAVEVVEEVKETAEEVAADTVDAVTDAVEEVKETAEEAVDAAADAVEEVKETAEEGAADTVDAVTDAVEEVKETAEEAVDAATDAVEEVKETAEEVAADTVDAVTDAVDEVKETAEEAVDAAADAVEEVKDAAEDVAAEAGEAVAEAADAVAEAVDEAAEPVLMGYAEYIAAPLDTEVMVETYVQAKQSWWQDKATIYTQAEDGAYFIYQMGISKEEYDKLVPGTKIRVTGYKAQWSGEVEITEATYEILEADAFIPEALDVTALLGTDELINNQNKLVSVKGAVVAAKKDADGKDAAFLYNWDGSGAAGSNNDLYFDVTVGEATYTFVVESYLCGEGTEVYEAVTKLNVGDVIDLEGFLYWYNGAQLHTTALTVLTPAAAPAAE